MIWLGCFLSRSWKSLVSDPFDNMRRFCGKTSPFISEDASSGWTELHSTLLAITFCLLSCCTSCLRYWLHIPILPLSTLALFYSEDEGDVFLRNVGICLPFCIMSTENTTIECPSFLWCCTLGDDEPRALVIIQISSVGYLFTCRLNSAYYTASTNIQIKQRNSTNIQEQNTKQAKQ